jgi:hypothetical protein
MVHQPPHVDDEALGFNSACQDLLLHSTPISKPSRSDVCFPLSTPRRTRAPSISSTTHTIWHGETDPGKLTVRVKGFVPEESEEVSEAMNLDTLDQETEGAAAASGPPSPTMSSLSIEDLPSEVQGLILDYIFGDLHSVASGSIAFQPGLKNISSSMRHPRRKAVSDLALISPAWRDLVQERIYRHIKIKGTRTGLRESEEWFRGNVHLVRHIRHIEFWVPVWGDRASLDRTFDTAVPSPTGNRDFHQLSSPANSSLMTANEVLGFNFKLSVYSATLSEIFMHASMFFPEARVLTIEGGHCKKSNMIRHFPAALWPDPDQSLQTLPNITTFAMRGAWNIMRDHSHWTTIGKALPNIEEWHCAYAKPRIEAYSTISQILLNLPPQLRHVTISLDGFYSKETGSSFGSTSSSLFCGPVHLCQRLGRIAPRLESLSYTGKICSCFWTAAAETLRKTKEEPRLKVLEIIVKKCCRPPVTLQHPESGETITTILIDDVMMDSASITNLTFISAFERLVVSTVRHLDSFSLLEYVRIRFIDLDSPCALLNPYFQLLRGKCYGLWNEEILDLLPSVRPGLGYEELSEGINPTWRKDDGVVLGTIYPRTKPKAIKSSSYGVLADARSL